MRKSRRQIRKAVQDLMSRLGQKVSPPVPVERIAQVLGVEIRYEPFTGELSGMLYKDKGRSIIGVNSLHSPTRQRFTIAHELAHLILHEDRDIFVDKNYRVWHRDHVSSAATDSDEIQANRFAAEMLMPYNLLIEDLGTLNLDFEDGSSVERLASRYKVSTQAMAFRLTNVGLAQFDESG